MNLLSITFRTLVSTVINNVRTNIRYTKMTNQKVAMITGGSSGIGRATAVALAKEGVNIATAARRTKEGEETVQPVKEAGSDGVFVKTDVATKMMSEHS